MRSVSTIAALVLALTLPATLTVLTSLVSFDIFGAAASSIQVQVLAIPVTQ
ncbi:hypothetical protein [Sphingomonas aquatilis]